MLQHCEAWLQATEHQVRITLTGGLLGRHKQPNGGLLGLAAGMIAVMATASLANQVLWGSRLGAGPSLAWAGVGALSVGLIWRYQVHACAASCSVHSSTFADALCEQPVSWRLREKVLQI